MSKWSNVDVQVMIPKHSKVSVKKIAASMFDDYKIEVRTGELGGNYIHVVELSFEENGDKAYHLATKFISELQNNTKYPVEGSIYVSW